MTTGPLAAIAATLGLLGALVALAGLSRGPPLRPRAPEASPPSAAGGGPARFWACVSPTGYCSSPPRPLGEPCTCLDPWQGWRAGRVRTDRPTAPDRRETWPSRAPAEDPEPPGWIVVP